MPVAWNRPYHRSDSYIGGASTAGIVARSTHERRLVGFLSFGNEDRTRRRGRSDSAALPRFRLGFVVVDARRKRPVLQPAKEAGPFHINSYRIARSLPHGIKGEGGDEQEQSNRCRNCDLGIGRRDGADDDGPGEP